MKTLTACVFFVLCGMSSDAFAQTPIKILFDATKAESAGNADWVIDADLHNMKWNPNGSTGGGNESNAQTTPTPAQSGITSSTPETYWKGALSNWAIDCVNYGYQVETLPYNGQITYGNSSNTQDLSNYKIFIVDEPNIKFTTSQKTALINFISNGGGLFMISDHDNSDRNGDGWDSPAIWNDFLLNNGVADSALGLTFNLLDFSGIFYNVSTSLTDPIIHGPFGDVTEVQWSDGTTMNIYPDKNSTVVGAIYEATTGSGTNDLLCAYGRYGQGKFAALGDSSPTDDGTGDSNDQLYNGYTQDANGNHQKLLMNITIWLAEVNPPSSVGINENKSSSINIYPNPVEDYIIVDLHDNSAGNKIELFNYAGELLLQKDLNSSGSRLDIAAYPKGLYLLRITRNKTLISQQKLIKM